jgi:hypothetical protein
LRTSDPQTKLLVTTEKMLLVKTNNRDPIEMFGVLSSTSLKTSQKMFTTSLELMVLLVSKRNEIEEIIALLRINGQEIKEIKNKFGQFE